MTINFPSNDKAATAAAMDDPRPGDRFTEMYAFYVVVLRRDGARVVFMEINPPCTVPRDGKVGEMHVADFRRRYAYRSIPGYFVTLIERGADVSGWEEAARYHLKIDGVAQGD